MTRKTFTIGAVMCFTFFIWSFTSKSESDGGIVTVYLKADFGLNAHNTQIIRVVYPEGYVEEQEISRRLGENTRNQDIAINTKLNELYKRGYKLVGQSESSDEGSNKHFTFTLQK